MFEEVVEAPELVAEETITIEELEDVVLDFPAPLEFTVNFIE